MQKATLTVDEAALISRNSAYQAARTGELPTIKIGKRLLVPRIAFEKMFEGAGQKISTEATG
jgi:Helix-turn-helix domain